MRLTNIFVQIPAATFNQKVTNWQNEGKEGGNSLKKL